MDGPVRRGGDRRVSTRTLARPAESSVAAGRAHEPGFLGRDGAAEPGYQPQVAKAVSAGGVVSLGPFATAVLTTGRARDRAERARTHEWGLKTDDAGNGDGSATTSDGAAAGARVGCAGTDSAVTCAGSAFTHQHCPMTDRRASRVFRATPEPGLVPWPRSASIKSAYFELPIPLTLRCARPLLSR